MLVGGFAPDGLNVCYNFYDCNDILASQFTLRTVRTDGEDRTLRRIDDRVEFLDPEHAEVGHRECAAIHVIEGQPPGLRLVDQGAGRRGDLRDVHPVRLAHDRGDQAPGARHRDGNVGVRKRMDRIAMDLDIDLGMACQCHADRLHEVIVEAGPDPQDEIGRTPQCDQLVGTRRDAQVEVRNVLLGRGQAGGDHLANLVERRDAGRVGDRPVGLEHGRCAGRSGRNQSEDIGLGDAATGPGALDGTEIDRVERRDPPCERRGEDPLVLWCDRAGTAERGLRRRPAGLIDILEGYPSAAPRASDEVRDTLRPLVAGGIAGALVVALPILMTVLVAAGSNRPAIDLEGAGRGSLHPALLLTFLAPDVFGSSGEMAEYWGPPSMKWSDTGLYIAQNVGQLYVGAVPALLLLIGVVSGVLWTRQVRFFSLALAVTLLYALGWYTPVFALFHGTLPGIDLYRRPADAVFLVGFLASVCAGYTAHRILTATLPQQAPWQWALVALTPITALVFALGLADHFDAFGRALPPLGEAAALLGGAAVALGMAAWIYPLRPVVAGGVLAAFTVLDLAIANGPGSATALPPAHYEVLEPKSNNDTIALLKSKVAEGRSETRRDRVELVGMGFHWPNASLTHRLENTLGYNPVRLGAYTRATGAEDSSVATRDRKLTPLFPSYRSPLADLLGLRWIASGAPIEEADKSLKPDDLRLIARTRDGYVYENARALPRVLFATTALAADFDAILATGQWPIAEEAFASTVLVDSAPLAAPTRRPGAVRIASYRHTEVTVEATSPDGGYVVLNDIWQPWWTAEVDGRPAKLLRANVLFRAVMVPPGRHTVRFVFRPVAGALAEAGRRWLGPTPPTTPTGARQR